MLPPPEARCPECLEVGATIGVTQPVPRIKRRPTVASIASRASRRTSCRRAAHYRFPLPPAAAQGARRCG